MSFSAPFPCPPTSLKRGHFNLAQKGHFNLALTCSNVITLDSLFSGQSTGISAQAGTLTLGKITANVVSSPLNFSVNPGATIEVIGPFSIGVGDVTIQGDGSVVFSGNNSYTGDLLVSDGSKLSAVGANSLSNPAGKSVVISSLLNSELDLQDANLTIPVTLGGTGQGESGAVLWNLDGNSSCTGTLSLTSDTTIGAAQGTLTLGRVSKDSSASLPTSLTFIGSGTIILNGSIDNTIADVTVNGGQVNFNAQNSYTGTTTINAGKALVAASASLGSNAAMVAANAELALAGGATITNPLTLQGTLRSSSGNNTYQGAINSGSSPSGTVVVDSGTLTLSGSGNQIGKATVEQGATLSLSDLPRITTIDLSGTLQTSANSLVSQMNILASEATITPTISSIIVDNITGNGSTPTLTKDGAGILSVRGSINNIGNIYIYNGELTLNGITPFPATTTSIYMQSGTAQLVLDDRTNPVTVTAPLFTTIGTTGQVAQLSSTGANTYSGDITLYFPLKIASTSGALTVGNISAAGVNNHDLTLVPSASAAITVKGTITDTNAISGQVPLNVVVNGAGVATFSQQNSYKGTTTVQQGSLVAGHNAAFSTSQVTVASGAVLEIGDGINIANTVVNSGTLRNTLGASSTFSGTLTGSGSIAVQGGALKLATSTSQNVNIQVDGTLDLSGATLSGPIANNGTITGSSNTNTVSGIISGIGEVGVSGETLTLSAANTYSGLTAVSSGILYAANNSALGTNSVQVSSGGTLALQGGVNISNPLYIAGTGVFSAGALTSASGSNTYSDFITLQGNASIGASSGASLQLNSSLQSASGSTYNLTFTGDGSIDASGNLSIEALNKAGAGSVTLLGSNTIGNGVLVNAGTLIAANQGALGSASAVIAQQAVLGLQGGIFVINDITNQGLLKNISGSNTYSGNMTGSGGVTVAGGTLTLSGTIPTTATITVNAGAQLNLPNTVTAKDLLGSGVVVITSANTLEVQNSNTTASIFTGTISGGGGVTLTQGMIAFSPADAGGNTYTGGTTVAAGATLSGSGKNPFGTGPVTYQGNSTVDVQGAEVTSNIVTASSSTLTVATTTSTSSILSGVISGDGALTKTGEGKVILSADNTYTGETTVSNGTLSVNGTIVSAVTVGPQATLQGTGTINGTSLDSAITAVTIQQAAALAPGNSIGTLTISAQNNSTALDLQDGAILEIEISPTASDQLIVAQGNVAISPAAVMQLLSDPLPYTSGTSYTIIEANGGTISGLPTISNSNPRLVPQLSLNSTNTELILTVDYRALSTDITGYNATAVADAVDVIYDSNPPSWGAIFTNLAQLSDADAQVAYNQMAPVQLKGMTLTQQDSTVRIGQSIGQRFQQEYDLLLCPCKGELPQTNVWMAGVGTFLDQGSLYYKTSPQVGYRANGGGAVVGLDRRIFDALVVGIAGAYSASHLHWDSSQGKGDVSTGYGGVYAMARHRGLYLDAAIFGGASSFHAGRMIRYPGEHSKATSSRHGKQISGHVDAGLMKRFGRYSLRPYNSFDFVAAKESSFVENGAGPLNLSVAASAPSYYRNELGLAGDSCFEGIGLGKVMVSGKVSWVRELRHGRGYQSHFVATEQKFKTVGYLPNRSLIAPGLALAWEDKGCRMSARLYWDGEFGRSISSQSIGGQLGYKF